MKIFDITLPLSADTPVWDGEKGVQLQQEAYISKGSDFNVSRVEFGVHSGTHIDAPFHLSDTGRSVEKIPLDCLMGTAVVLGFDDSVLEITEEILLASGFNNKMKRLLLKTRNTKYWIESPNKFNHDFVALSTDAAHLLVEAGVVFVGIDYFSISPFSNLKPPHEILLKAGIVILENAYLVDVVPGIYNLICLPIKLAGADGAPVRAVLTAD